MTALRKLEWMGVRSCFFSPRGILPSSSHDESSNPVSTPITRYHLKSKSIWNKKLKDASSKEHPPHIITPIA